MEYEERENEKEDYRTDPAFFRKGSGWNDVDIYNKSVGGIKSSLLLTSGTLGIPGVCLLYGITFYQIL